MTNLAIIPARFGSKGLKKKNIRPLIDKPLIAYSIEAAIESSVFSEVMVSTDSEEIVEISKQYGASVPFLRPEKLATDKSTTNDVIIHALNYYGQDNFDTFCILQPTSPLRTKDDIVKAYKLFEEKKANAVVSLCETDHHPFLFNTIGEEGKIDNFIDKSNNGKRRQELKQYFRINGAIYISKVDYYIKYQNFYHQNAYGYIMPRIRSVDIDDILDFKIAETLIKDGLVEG